MEAEVLRDVERRRLRSLVAADMAVAETLHAADFALVNPGGGLWARDFYLGGIASGDIDYSRFDVVSDIDVMVEGGLAVLRYRSAIEIAVAGDVRSLQCWHMDSYRAFEARDWRAVWSQATDCGAT